MPFEQSTFGRFVHSCSKACTADLLPSFIQLQNNHRSVVSRDTLQPGTKDATLLTPKITTSNPTCSNTYVGATLRGICTMAD
ncbi:MAG: hypothetical protein IT249_17070 [Chitinophagaceae bacterium]|nr:hypothetical protein [Chitinophagaceae bacterium]